MDEKRNIWQMMTAAAKGLIFEDVPEVAEQAGRYVYNAARRGGSRVGGFVNDFADRRREEIRKREEEEEAAASRRFQAGEETVGDKLGKMGFNRHLRDSMQDSVGDFAEDAVRAFPRSIVATGRSLAQGIDQIEGGSAGSEEYDVKPRSRLMKFVFGEEPIKTVQNRAPDNAKLLEQYGVDSSMAVPLGFLGATASTGLDLIPIPGKKEAGELAVKQIAKATDERAVKVLLKRFGKFDGDIERILPELVEETDPKKIRAIFNDLPEQFINVSRGGPVDDKKGRWFAVDREFADQFKDDWESQGVEAVTKDYAIPKSEILDLSDPDHLDLVRDAVGEDAANELITKGHRGLPNAGDIDKVEKVAKKLGFKGAAFSETDEAMDFGGKDIKSYAMFDKKDIKEGHIENVGKYELEDLTSPSMVPDEYSPDPNDLNAAFLDDAPRREPTPDEEFGMRQAEYETALDRRGSVESAIGEDQINKVKRFFRSKRYQNGDVDITSLKGYDDIAQSIRYMENNMDMTADEALQMINDLPTKGAIKGMKPTRAERAMAKIDELTPGNAADDPATVEYYKNKVRNGEDIGPIDVVKKADGSRVIDDGNHRAEALRQLGKSEVPVNEMTMPEKIFRSLSDQDKDRVVELSDEMDQLNEIIVKSKRSPEFLTGVKQEMERIKSELTDIGKRGSMRSINEREAPYMMFDADTADEIVQGQSLNRLDVGEQRLNEQFKDVEPYEFPEPTPDAPAPTRLRGLNESVKDNEAFLEDIRKRMTAEYTPLKNESTLAFADSIMSQGAEFSERFINDYMGTTEGNAVFGKLLKHYNETKQVEKAVDLIDRVGESATRLGQAIQILSQLRFMSPEGMVAYAKRQLAKNVNPKRMAKIDKEAGKITDDMLKVNEEVVDDVVNNVVNGVRGVKQGKRKETADSLAKRVEAHLATAPEKDDPIRDMVNTLYSQAKELLPKKTKRVRNPIDLIRRAVTEQDDYIQAWQKAQEEVWTKYADNDEALEKLDRFLISALERPYSPKQVNDAVQGQLRTMEVDLANLVRQHYTKVNETGDTLSQRIMNELGLGEDEAKQVADDVAARFKVLTEDKKRSILESMAKERKKPIRKEYADRLIELSNLGAIEKKEFRELAAKKLKLPYITDDLAENIRVKADKFQTMEEGVEKERALYDLLQDIQEGTQTKGQAFKKVLDEYRYGNMLSSPLTHIVNVSTNIGQTGVIRPVTMLATGATDMAVSMLTGKKREAYMSEVPAYYKGFANALPDAAKSALEVIQGKRSIMRPDIQNVATRSRFTRPARFVLRTLEAGDIFFQTIGKQAEMEALALKASRQGKAVTQEMLEEAAEKQAQYNIFRAALDPKNQTGQGKLLSMIDRATASLNQARNLPVVGWIIPFVHTPMNVLKQGIEYSPLGIATLWGNERKAEQFSKIMVGSTVMAGAAMLAFRGDSTWAAPKGKKEREVFYQQGMRPYSIKIGDKWVSYNKLGPIAYPIALAASMKWEFQQNPKRFEKTTLDQWGGVFSGVAGFFSDQSYVQNLGDLVNAAEGDLTAGEKVIKNSINQNIPMGSLQNWVSKLMDPVYREPKNIFEALASRTPGLSKTVDPYPGQAERSMPAANAFSPAELSEYEPYIPYSGSSGSSSSSRYTGGKRKISPSQTKKGTGGKRKISPSQTK